MVLQCGLYPLGEKDGEKLFLANGDEVNTRWFSTGGEDKALKRFASVIPSWIFLARMG